MTIRPLLAAAGAAALLALAAPQRAADQPDTNRLVRELTSRVEGLERRVESLEAIAALDRPAMADRLGAAEEPRPGAGGADLPSRIMVLDGVETAVPDSSAAADIERLRDEVESLEKTVNDSQRRITSYRGEDTSGGYRSYRDMGPSRRAQAEGEMLAKYKSQLRQKQGELTRLEREANEPRQIIFGNWEGKIVTLRSTKDLSRALDKAETGDYLTWDGRRISEDGASQEWVVTRIEKVAPPAGSNQ
jgi:predicted RNase H-like nuclease (RuvC/YqgF family)